MVSCTAATDIYRTRLRNFAENKQNFNSQNIVQSLTQKPLILFDPPPPKKKDFANKTKSSMAAAHNSNLIFLTPHTCTQ